MASSRPLIWLAARTMSGDVKATRNARMAIAEGCQLGQESISVARIMSGGQN